MEGSSFASFPQGWSPVDQEPQRDSESVSPFVS
jgi:hypothetical protein